MTTEKTYIQSLDKQKQGQIDLLIAEHKIYSGTNYSDIIIPQNLIIKFINGLTNIGIVINSVSWWCNATDDNKTKYGCPHGYGGPMTTFGWFSEMSHDFDEICEMESELFLSLDNDFRVETIKNINEKVVNHILTKQTTTYADGTYLTFKNNPCLTPGLDLFVPDNWTRELKE